MSSILVTGGAGYIGSHTCKRLHQAGHTPVVLDTFERGHDWAVKWGPRVEGDVADRELVERTLREHDIEAVVHFAAYAYVGESMAKPGMYFRNNVTKTMALMEAMLATGVPRLVFSSSCATYGIHGDAPITEEMHQVPLNTYGESKLAAERALKWYAQAHDLSWTVLRYFNAAGADPGGELGEDHDPEPHLIPRVILAAMGQLDEIKIFGTDYPTPDGTCVRDYVHVCDLADAHLAALHHLGNGGGSGPLNLGTGRGHSVREVIDSVERVSGKPVPVVEAPRRPGDAPVLVADPSKAQRVLNWKPHYTDMDAIIQTAWNWHSTHHA